MNRKYIIGGIVSAVVIVIAITAVVALQKPTEQVNTAATLPEIAQTQTAATDEPEPNQASEAKLPEGKYTTYSEENRSNKQYNRTILFFHAPWCPQCRAFEKNLNSTAIPEGTQILKTDYDSSTDLKKQYGVTLQTTFVSVNPNGEQIKKWVGYTSNHSVEALLAQFKL